MNGYESVKHKKGVDLVRSVSQLPQPQRTGPPEDAYRVEVWSALPEEGGSLMETISRSSDFNVSAVAYAEAMKRRVGRYLIHINCRSIMRRELGREEQPLPERTRLRVRAQPGLNKARPCPSWKSGTFWVVYVLFAITMAGFSAGKSPGGLASRYS